MKHLHVVLIIFFTVMFAIEGFCHKNKFVFYSIPCEKIGNLNKAIKKAIFSQPVKYAPITVEVTDEYVIWNNERLKEEFFVSYVKNEVRAIYFENVTSQDFMKAKRVSII